MNIENIILSATVRDDSYRRKSLQYLKPDYFDDDLNKKLFVAIKDYINKCNTPPSYPELCLMLPEKEKEIKQKIFDMELPTSNDWILEKTESFCQEKEIYMAITKAIAIYEGEDKKHKVTAIPDILKEAVSVSFDSNVGMDLYTDAEAMYEYYTNPEIKLPFLVDSLNEITNGGIPTKTLNIVVGGTNVGKSMALISLACDYIRQSYDVLYISMEMRSEEILRRVNSNLLGIDLNQLNSIDKQTFINKINGLKNKAFGKLKVKEYPPVDANCLHFNALLHELKTKQDFKPVVLIVDYLGIIDSIKIKAGSQSSYYFLKSASEELRALAVKNDLLCFTAMQVNRQGIDSDDLELNNISESMGVAHTADFMIGLIRTNEHDENNQIVIKQLKNRFANKTTLTRMLLNVDINTQKIYEQAGTRESAIVYDFNQSKQLSDQSEMSTIKSNVSNKFKILDSQRD
jgi:archaellum biogenesis ATPase FlaH